MPFFFTILFAALVTLLPAVSANAIQESRPLPADSRLRVITYQEGGIHKYTGFYDYQASILLEEGETVKTLAMGVTTGWYINPSENRIFIKPISNDPIETNTNALMVTNKRVYHLILEAAEAESMNDPDLVWETRFVYPESNPVKPLKQSNEPDLNDPDKNYNFNYTVSGSEFIAPVRVFDDGEFTFFQFSYSNADIPAFFLVDAEGREALVNYSVNGDYIVIQRVTSQLTLRYGDEVACVFNENRPFTKRLKRKSS